MNKSKSYFRMKKLVPNMVTILALCFGLSSIKFAIDFCWEKCIYMTFLAALLDGMDGRIARLMDCTSDFGAELDSLVDFVNFGASPAIVLYMFSLSNLPIIGWASVLIFVVATGTRLARFNSSVKSYGNFLVGVPAPFGAVISFIPFTFFCGFNINFNPYVYFIFMMISALLMISTVPTLYLRKIYISKKFFIPLSFLIVIFASTTLYNHWIILCFISCFYLFSIPFTNFLYKKSKKQ